MIPESRNWRQWAAVPSLLVLGCLPLIVLAIAHRLWIRRRALVGLGEKIRGTGPRREPGAIVVHGVSMGEVALMRPVVPPLEAATGRPCVLTTTSETGGQALEKHFPKHDRRWWPLDLPWAVAQFWSRTKPAAVIILELELWPLALAACHLRGIPVVMVNARCSKRSFRGYRRFRPFIAPLLKPVTVLAQNPLWGAHLRALGAGNVQVTGSLKADVVAVADADTRDAEALRLGLPPGAGSGKPVLLLASTSEGEEEAGLRWFAQQGRGLGWRCVVCPRHPERGDRIAAQARQFGLVTTQTSHEALPAPTNHVIIVDEIGRLAALYANAAIAVVGGSFGSGRGGQNMLEAAAAGCATIVGPDTRNQPDAMALLRAADGVIETTNAQLTAVLDDLVTNPQRRRVLGNQAQHAWFGGRGAIDRTLAALQRHPRLPKA